MTVYVAHTCKNRVCQKAFLAQDKYNAQDLPPKWRYCPCCEPQGLISAPDPGKTEWMKQVRDNKQKKSFSHSSQSEISGANKSSNDCTLEASK